MKPPAPALSPLELDALTELVNIGVSRAAASLREMVGEEVVLSVPAVAMVTRERAAEIIGEREAGKLVAVHQTFAGEVSGTALVIFPETNSLELVRAVTGGNLPLEDIIELEEEALSETGNIILNGCLGTIANLLQRSLKMSLPEVLRRAGFDFFDLADASPSEEAVLFLYINFSLRQRDIRGYIALIMSMPALAALKGLIGELILRTAKGAEGVHVGS